MNSSGGKIRLIGVASCGGHEEQLRRMLQPLAMSVELIFVTTGPSASTTRDNAHYTTVDFSRKTLWRFPASLWQLYAILRREKPDAIVTTGATPGLSAVIVGKFLGIRTLWIDSLANSVRLSASGVIARHIASRTATQWADVAAGTPGVDFAGNCFEPTKCE